MKRQRGRGRKPGGGGGGGNQPNRTLESNGPENTKIRGSAATIYEKYMQYTRDAMSSGDRVGAESYQQHAEHYYRMLRAMQPHQMPQLEQRFGQDFDYEDEGGGEGEEAEGGEQPEGVEAEAGGEQPYMGDRPQRQNNGQQYRDRDQDGYQQRRERGPRPDQQARQERPDRQDRQERPPQEGGEFGGDDAQMQGGDQEGFRNNRRRRNRGRYRPGDDRGGDGRGPRGPDGGGDNDQGPVEGFGESAPAFVTGE